MYSLLRICIYIYIYTEVYKYMFICVYVYINMLIYQVYVGGSEGSRAKIHAGRKLPWFVSQKVKMLLVMTLPSNAPGFDGRFPGVFVGWVS